MVKKFLKFIGYFLFFIFMLIFFSPKENLYYLAEKELAKKSILISKESIKDSGFSFNIKNAHISMQEIESAIVSDLKIDTFLFFNTINISNIAFANTFKNFLPLNIDSVKISYSILNPLNIVIKSNGGFGNMSGTFNISKRVLNLKIKPSKLMKTKYRQTLRNFRKNKDGEYIYVKNI